MADQCPKCGSLDVDYFAGFHSKDGTEPDEPAGDTCRKCGFFWEYEPDPDDARDREEPPVVG